MGERGAPPKVLMVVEQLRRRVPGGIGAYARGLLRGLAQCAAAGEGVDLTLLASRGPRQGDPLERYGLPLVLSKAPGPLLTRLWDHGWWRVPHGYGVVHSVSLAAPPHRTGDSWRLVVTVHDVAWRRHPEATTGRGRHWHEAALRRVRDSDAAMVVTSRLVAADLAADGVDPARITIVRGGSDHVVAEDVAGTDALLGRLGVAGSFVLTVGTLEPRKNLARLMEAFDRARPSVPGPPLLLVVVGPPGWGRTPVQASPAVRFTGAVTDGVLAGLYRRARAFAYVPLTEGYGLPPLEAMRLGVPTVVAREVPSVWDLGDVGPAPARLVDPLDVDDIAAGLVEVLTDEALRVELVARGEAHAGARTWREAASRHLRLWAALT